MHKKKSSEIEREKEEKDGKPNLFHTCGQVFLWELVIWTLAMLITAAAVMLLSAVTTSSFVSLLLGMLPPIR